MALTPRTSQTQSAKQALQNDAEVYKVKSLKQRIDELRPNAVANFHENLDELVRSILSGDTPRCVETAGTLEILQKIPENQESYQLILDDAKSWISDYVVDAGEEYASRFFHTCEYLARFWVSRDLLDCIIPDGLTWGVSAADLSEYLTGQFGLSSSQAEDARPRILAIIHSVKDAPPKWDGGKSGLDAIEFYRTHWESRSVQTYLEDLEYSDPALILAIQNRCRNYNARQESAGQKLSVAKILPPRRPLDPLLEAKRKSDRDRKARKPEPG